MSNICIVDLQKILLPKFLGEGKKINCCGEKTLTAAGENYDSIMLALKIIIEDSNSGREETINVFAKLLPHNEYKQNVFQSHTSITLNRELNFYEKILPTLQSFQLEYGIREGVLDFFPEFYGGRVGEFNGNAVILLENLKEQGYQNIEKTLGFDFETSKLILMDLAKIHALSIALIHKKPQVFDEKIRPYLNDENPFSGLETKEQEDMLYCILKTADGDAECKNHLSKIKKAFLQSDDECRKNIKSDEPFTTICQSKLWINNTMLKFEGTRPVKYKIIDFQIINFYFPGKDLIFFLFTSVQNDVIRKKYDKLVKEYYKTFKDTLKKLNVNATPFSFQALEQMIVTSAKENTFLQCCIMLNALFSPKHGSMERFSVDSQEHKEKFCFLIKEFVKRNWI